LTGKEYGRKVETNIEKRGEATVLTRMRKERKGRGLSTERTNKRDGKK
jgi:hypothetical protein